MFLQDSSYRIQYQFDIGDKKLSDVRCSQIGTGFDFLGIVDKNRSATTGVRTELEDGCACAVVENNDVEKNETNDISYYYYWLE